MYLTVQSNPKVVRYRGRAGYPLPCGEGCSALPGYDLFHLPSATSDSSAQQFALGDGFLFDIEESWNHRKEYYDAKQERIRKRKEMARNNIDVSFYDPFISYLESGRGGQFSDID